MNILLRSSGRFSFPTPSGVRFYHSNHKVVRPLQFFKIPLTVEENMTASRNWAYPSDHIPVFAKVNEFRVATLNILNSAFVSHLQKVPGWNDSYIIHSHQSKSLTYPEFTCREEEIIRIVLLLLRESPVVDALCVQECSTQMYHLLKNTLEPLEIAVVLGDGKRNNHVVTLVNKDAYSLHEVTIKPIFQRYIKEKKEWYWDQWRPAVDLVLEEKATHLRVQRKFRLVNIHISSAGQSHSYKVDRLKEVKAYLQSSEYKGIPVVIAGDYNACKSLASQVFEKERFKSLCKHYTQIENIVSIEGDSLEEEGAHMVSIDDLLLQYPKDTCESALEAFEIHPEHTSDTKAATIVKTVFDPLIPIIINNV